MKHGFFRELKRRHVYRVAVAYAVIGWLLIEVATQVFPLLNMPIWSEKLVLLLILFGFPVALVVAWAFELTPEGVRRTEPSDSPDARALEQDRKFGHTLDRVIISVLVVTVIFMAWRMWAQHKEASKPSPIAAATSLKTPSKTSAPAPAASTIPAKSIAVLPFENLSTDKANAYFADGMQDLILTKLADIGDLAVISRTSTMKYGSHPENLQTVGKQLGVAAILEGSVQKAGNQVLINVQLIDARNDHHIWANSYTRTLKNVFSVEGEVASKIAGALNAKLSPAETHRLASTLSGNSTANDLYLRGNYYADQAVNHHDVLAANKAIAFYRKAIAGATDFAQARAQLSMIESIMAWHGGVGGKVAPLYVDARAQAELAMKLAPDLPDAHVAMGRYYFFGKFDLPAAIKAYATALALRPNDSNAMTSKAWALLYLGEFDKAINLIKKALAHDPNNVNTFSALGFMYMSVDRYHDAEQTLQHALAINPDNAGTNFDYIYTKLFYHGDVTGALDALKGHDSPMMNMGRVYVLTYARRYDDALAVLHSIPDSPALFSANKNGPKSLMLGYLYHLLGKEAKARALYAKALPQTRLEYAALKGSTTINRSFTLLFIASAEIGSGKTSAGLADTAKVLTVAEQSPDFINRPWLMMQCALIYANAGRADLAIPVITKAFAIPGSGATYSPVMLWLDPHWDPIRKDPSFQALEKKYAKYRPATVPKLSKG